MSSYLITGCSRGLGLVLAKQLASRPTSEVSTIFATARSDSSAQLKDLAESSNGRVILVQLDVTDEKSIQSAVKKVEASLGGKGLDVLINNAGIPSYSPHGIQTMDNLDSVLQTNVTGVHMVTAAFLPLLRRASRKLIVNVSTTLGSFGYSKKFAPMPVFAYKISKAALNMLTLQYAYSFADEGFTIIAVSPGWLRTDLGGPDMADLEPDVGADAVLKIVKDVDKDSNGQYLDVHIPGWENDSGLSQYPGGTIPW